MNKISISRKVLIALIIHYIVFATLYTIPFVTGHDLLPESFYIEALRFSIERWLVWVVPSIILIKVFEKDLYINFKEMFLNKVKFKTLAWCILPLFVYLICGIIVTKYTGFSISGTPIRDFKNISEIFSVFSECAWGTLVGPAIPEEMVFRAWMMNVLLGKSPSKKNVIYSIIMSSTMFVIIHLPSYFYFGYSLTVILFKMLFVFVMGSVFAIMFYKSKNILVPIFAHWLVDIVYYVFYLV